MDILERQIRELINELEVTVVYDSDYDESLDCGAHYIAQFNIIAVNSKLSEFERQKAILHELTHASRHRNEVRLYNIAFALHSKMENEAECSVVENVLISYMNENFLEPVEVNAVHFLDACDIDTKYESFVKELLVYFDNRADFA